MCNTFIADCAIAPPRGDRLPVGSGLKAATYRLRPEQIDWLNEQPDGASESLRRILDDVMTLGTKGKVLQDEKMSMVAGEMLTFEEFVKKHVLKRGPAHREAYIRSLSVRDYLIAFGRSFRELQATIDRLEAERAAAMPVFDEPVFGRPR